MSAVVNDLEEERQGNVAAKRPRGSPTRFTPERQQKRVPLRELVNNDAGTSGRSPRSSLLLPSRLTYEIDNVNDESNSKKGWSDSEVKALVEFVLFYTNGETWPSHKHSAFWKSASEFVKNRGGMTNVYRSGKHNRLHELM